MLKYDAQTDGQTDKLTFTIADLHIVADQLGENTVDRVIKQFNDTRSVLI